MPAQQPMRQAISPQAIVRSAESLRLLGRSASSAMVLVAALCDCYLSADDLSLRIEADPVICARVLRVANSAYYGHMGSVATVRRALMVLGLNTVRGVAAAACISQAMPSRLIALPDAAAFLRHGLATAVATEMLALAELPDRATEAFIAALLQNLGVVLQGLLDPAGQQRMIEARRAGDDRDMPALEKEFCVVSHGDAASIVFAHWNLPASFVAVAEHHHDASAAPEPERALTAIVGRASRLALACGQVYSLEPSCSESDALTLEEASFASLCFRDELLRRLEHLSSALS